MRAQLERNGRGTVVDVGMRIAGRRAEGTREDEFPSRACFEVPHVARSSAVAAIAAIQSTSNEPSPPRLPLPMSDDVNLEPLAD